MSLRIVASKDQRLLTPGLIDELLSARSAGRSVVLLVPSLSLALEVSRGLSAYPELSLGITCTTPLAWARERWEVWGDGRTLVDPAVRAALCYRIAVMEGRAQEQNPLAATKGMVRTLASFAKDALAWLPENPLSEVTDNERRFLSMARDYKKTLAEHGFIEPCEVMAELPRIFEEQGVEMPSLVAAGFADAPYPTVELLVGLSALTSVNVHICGDDRPQSALLHAFGEQLLSAASQRGAETLLESRPSSEIVLPGELGALSQALFRAGEPGIAPVSATGAVRRAVAAGPFAEYPLVVQEVERLAKDGCRTIAVAVSDVGAAWDALAPRLAARKLLVQGGARRKLGLTSAARAFLSFASCVASLANTAASWDEAKPSGLLPMGWWPPRAITDFMLSSISGVGEDAAWSLDKRLRGNRALTPQAVLDILQRESVTSHACAQATRLIADGRIGSAAHLLAQGLLENGADPTDESIFVLESIAQVQASVSHLGLSVAGEGRLKPSDLVELLAFICESLSLRRESCLGPTEALATVRICSRAEAAQLEPGSVDAVVLMQLTSAEWPLKQADDALACLFQKLGLAAPSNPLALARYRFSRAICAASRTIVLESSARDLDARQTYPAVLLSELLSCYPKAADLPCAAAAEDEPAAKLSASGKAPALAGVSELPAQDHIDDRSMLVLPRSASAHNEPLALSATQIEAYLDCPLKWFTQSRIKIDGIDADFGGMQKGSFAHVVLERTHRELLRRAAVAQGLISQDDSADNIPAVFVPGARVTRENLGEASALLDAVFDEHLEGQRARALRKESQSLVPHTASELFQVGMLRRDLHAVLEYEADRLAGFEPRYFELRFGRGEGARTVTYAGAEFVGTIDRIDVNERGDALVIDYKHKNPSGFAGDYSMFSKDGPGEGFSLEALALPRHIQTLAYAQIIRRLYPELRVVGAVYLATMGAEPEQHVIAGLATQGALVHILGEKAAGAQEMAMCPPDGVDMGDLLDAVEKLVARALANLAAAQIPASPRDKESCRFCPVMRCERRLG